MAKSSILSSTQVEAFDPEIVIAEILAEENRMLQSQIHPPHSSKESFFSTLHPVKEAENNSSKQKIRSASIRMATLKRFAPLVLGIIRKPGLNADPTLKGSVLRQMIDDSVRISEEIAPKIAQDQNQGFYTDQVLSVVTEMVATQWVLNGQEDIGKTLHALLNNMPDVSDMEALLGETQWMPGGNLQGKDFRAGITMSLMKASEPLVITLKEAGINGEVFDHTFIKLQDALLDISLKYLQTIPTELPSSTRLQMIQNYLGVSSRILRSELETQIYEVEKPWVVESVINDWSKGMVTLENVITARASMIAESLNLESEGIDKQEIAIAPSIENSTKSLKSLFSDSFGTIRN